MLAAFFFFLKSLILSTDAASDAKRSIPLVASDSSSGGSDSEEEDKTTSGPPNTISTCVPGNKPDHLKRLVHYFPNFPNPSVVQSELQKHIKLLRGDEVAIFDT